MRKSAKRKLFFAALSLLILISLSIVYFMNSGKRIDQKTYFDLKTAPEAQTVEDLKLLDPAVNSKANLHTEIGVSQAAKWYQDHLSGTGWVLDVPPQNPADEQIQMIQLRKGVDTLSISLINDGNGGTDVIFEKVGDQNAGEEGEDP